MRHCYLLVCIFPAVLFLNSFARAQEDTQPSSAPASTMTVPRLIRIRGAVHDESGKPLSGTIGITFTFYQDENGQPPVWQESQNVSLDATGHYNVFLGASNDAGLPLEIFSSGEARWLGVRADGQPEQPRILFLSVAYALKAADSDMLGGKPASAFVLAGSAMTTQAAVAVSAAATSLPGGSHAATTGTLPLLVAPLASCSSVTSDGTATVNQVAKFTSACNIENSAIFESGGNVGIGNTKPGGTLDVSGTAMIRGSLTAMAGAVVPPTGTATATQPFISNPLDIEASVYNTSVSSAGTYVFRWEAEPIGNDTSNTSATLNLLYGVPGAISETGLSVNKNGTFNFASGQTFPGAGTGTVTSVGTGTGLTGGPITSSGTISIATGGVTNSLLQNSSITVKAGTGLSGGGTVALGGSVTLSNAGGTVTSVNTGAGLTGGPITTTGTISIPSAGVTNSMLANPSITVVAGSGLSGGGTVALGGTVTLTGNLSGSSHGVAYFSNPTNITSTAAPTNGQILIGSTGSAPVLSTLTAGSNISIANGPGSITISASGGGGTTTLPFFATAGARTGASQAATKNVTKLWGFLLPYNVTTTQLTYDIMTADNTANNYDVGIFSNSGALIVDLGTTPGTTFAAAKGFNTLAWTQGSTSLPAGRYYLGVTTNCASACAKLAAATAFVSYAINASAGATTGGALPSTITPPADNWNTGDQPSVVIQ